MPGDRIASRSNGLGNGATPSEQAKRVFQHRPWLLTVLLTRLGGNREVAEDLFGTIVEEVISDRLKLARVDRLEPWLYRVAVNKATDWARQQHRHDQLCRRLASDPSRVCKLTPLALPPLDCLLQKERISSLQNALDSLDPVDLEILNLKYVHNWSYAQLGHHLGLGFNQIANRLREARRRLKSALLRSPFAQELLEVERRDPA